MPNVSIFKNVGEPSNPEHIDLITYLEKTRDGEWQDIVLECRNIEDEKEKKAFKKKMPTTTLSGQFFYRDDKSLEKHSTFISMDLDDVENLNAIKSILCNDRYVFSVFVSTGGHGLRVIFRIDPKKHREAFIGIRSYLFEKYGITSVDPNGINVSKPYLVSYDPYLFLSPYYDDVPVFKKYIKETPIKNIPDHIHTPSDFDNVVSQILSRKLNICEDYNDWLKLGFSLSDEFGEGGRRYFHELSSVSRKYDAKITDKQFNSCLKARGSGSRAGISTFYYLAKLSGANIVTEQTKAIIRTTKHGKKAGLKKAQIVENLEKHSNISGSEDIVSKVFDQESQFGNDEEDSVLYQLEMFISSNYSLLMNEVTGFLENDGEKLNPSDLNSMFIAAKKLMPKLQYDLMIRLLKSDFIESYNPFFKFFNSDGVAVRLPPIPDKDQPSIFSPVIDKLCETIITNNPAYTSYFVKKWIVSIVSAAHKVHSPLLLCLLGAQNSGKTEWFRRLLPQELKAYYAESKLDKEKDDEILMTENIIIMDDELGGKSKTDALKLKNITSKDYFSLRRPYGESNEKILRLAVLCGTSNIKTVMYDQTGNRRIIPIEVLDIDKTLYNSIDKKELFLEAYDLYKKGFDWRIGIYDIPYLNENKEDYEQTIKEKELIEKYFCKGDDARLTTTEILVEIEILTHQKLNINTIGRELERMGFERKSTRMPNGATPKKWAVVRTSRHLEPYKDGIAQQAAKKANEEDNMPF